MNDNICPIGMQEMTQPFTLKACNHKFELENISSWIAIRKKKTCPVCRKEINKNDENYLYETEFKDLFEEFDREKDKYNTVPELLKFIDQLLVKYP